MTGIERLTPNMVRVVLEGGDLDTLTMPDATDAYVNVALPPPGAPYGDVFSPGDVRERWPKEAWPARRRYTVRAWDPAARRLTLDFVVHGTEGVAGPWAAAAQPTATCSSRGARPGVPAWTGARLRARRGGRASRHPTPPLGDRGLDRADMSCSPYWRREMTDEAWRQVKSEYVAAMEADVA